MCTYTALTMTWCVSHCRKNRAKCGSVCVANHTTPIDIVMLAVDNSFTLVGLFGELLTSTADCYALHHGTSMFDDQYHVCDSNIDDPFPGWSAPWRLHWHHPACVQLGPESHLVREESSKRQKNGYRKVKFVSQASCS